MAKGRRQYICNCWFSRLLSVHISLDFLFPVEACSLTSSSQTLPVCLPYPVAALASFLRSATCISRVFGHPPPRH